MRLKGQEQVAAMFGVAPKTITEWQVLGFPVAVQGGPGIPSEYDTQPCIAWLVERELRKVRAESPKDRVLRLQGDKIEREMAIDAGELIPAADVEPLWAGAVLAAREFLAGEPARIASLSIGLGKEDLQRMLEQSFATFLAKLADWRSVGDDEDESEAGADEGDEEE